MAYALRSYLCMLARDADGALRWGAKAIELAPGVGATTALVRALNAVGSTEIVLLEPSEGIAKLLESARLARKADDDVGVAGALINLGSASGRSPRLCHRREVSRGIDCLLHRAGH